MLPLLLNLLPWATVIADKACFRENLSGLALRALECVDVTAVLHAELNVNDQERSRTRMCDDTKLSAEWETCNEVVTQFMASQEAQQQLHDAHNSTCVSAEDASIVASTMCQYHTTDGYAAAFEQGLCMHDDINGDYCIDNYGAYVGGFNKSATGLLKLRDGHCQECAKQGYSAQATLFDTDYAFQTCVVQSGGARPNATDEISHDWHAFVMDQRNVIMSVCAPSGQDKNQTCGSVLIDTIEASYESVQQQEHAELAQQMTAQTQWILNMCSDDCSVDVVRAENKLNFDLLLDATCECAQQLHDYVLSKVPAVYEAMQEPDSVLLEYAPIMSANECLRNMTSACLEDVPFGMMVALTDLTDSAESTPALAAALPEIFGDMTEELGCCANGAAVLGDVVVNALAGGDSGTLLHAFYNGRSQHTFGVDTVLTSEVGLKEAASHGFELCSPLFETDVPVFVAGRVVFENVREDYLDSIVTDGFVVKLLLDVFGAQQADFVEVYADFAYGYSHVAFQLLGVNNHSAEIASRSLSSSEMKLAGFASMIPHEARQDNSQFTIFDPVRSGAGVCWSVEECDELQQVPYIEESNNDSGGFGGEFNSATAARVSSNVVTFIVAAVSLTAML